MAKERPLAVVTGASSGIGAAFTRALALRGYDLALVARREDRLRRLADLLASQYHVNCTPLPADLTNDAQLRGVEEYLAASTHLELLVNNAGFGSRGRFWEAPVEEFRRDAPSARDGHAAAHTRRAAESERAKRRRHYQCLVRRRLCGAARASTSYYATKAWINCFTEGLHLELQAAGSRVRMQALCPGFTKTEFHDVLGIDRNFISEAWWMPAEDVVEESLRGLENGKLFVVPGWRYKLLVAVLRALPRGVLHYALIKGPASLRRERRKK